MNIGSKKGYFGVRDDFAVVVFLDGPVLVSVELHAKKGKAVDLKSAVIKVATTIAG